jgi:hypothetical protein
MYSASCSEVSLGCEVAAAAAGPGAQAPRESSAQETYSGSAENVSQAETWP